jgi:hypothetical protein
MSRKLLAVATAVAALAFAGTAAAAGNGATVVNDQGCTQTVFALVCTVVKTTTNTATTPSGNVSYVMYGTVERTMTFVFGGTYTTNSEIHSHALLKDGEFSESSDHYVQTWESISGTYHLSCIEGYDIHWANGQSQIGDFVLNCTVL